MSRPTQTRLGGPGFAPQNAGATQRLQVNAPLNVQAAPSGAEQLAAVLDQTFRVAAPILRDKIAEEGRAAFNLGVGDATSGTVDPTLEAKDRQYATGVKRVASGKAVLAFRQHAEKFYAEEFDKTKSPEELQQELDRLAAGYLGQFLDDPESASWIANDVINYVSSKTLQHNGLLANEFVEESVNTALGVLEGQVRDLGVVDYQGHFDTLAPVIGRSDAHKAVVQKLIEMAQEFGDETILDGIPGEVTTEDGQKIAGPASTYREEISQAREQARKVKDARDAGAKRELRLDYFARAETRFANGQWFTRRELDKERASGNISDDEYLSLWARSERGRIEGSMKLDMAAALGNSGLPYRLWKGVIPDSTIDEAIRKDVDALAARTPDEQGNPDLVAAASAVYEREGFVDTRVSGALTYVTASDPKGFEQAAKQYHRLSPTQRAAFVPNEDQRMRLERFAAARAAGVPAEAAAKEIALLNPDVVRQNRARYQREANKEAQGIDGVKVGEAGGFLGFGSTVTVGSLENAPMARMEINRQARLRIDGGTPPEDAYKLAGEDFRSRFDVVKTSGGKAVAVPKVAGMPPDFGQALQWANQRLPEGRRWAPIATSDSTLLVQVGSDGLPVDSVQVAPQRLYRDWYENSSAERAAEIRQRHDAFMQQQSQLGALVNINPR